ncbi:Terminase-like family protein [Limihaloglobus sulfuriphilus]|uniref:Terminase-like family protein n=1 Tax=Limihaloglobus sulfuriphilus TaxID=1851148 RepID=A0A1Q2MF12_9BACT|nr:hypothetical protein [Limihaloglobus sulfuriphilus]AQQ71291.1 Terminase-like family protein [Limihaloglobus sulfuriphilus]
MTNNATAARKKRRKTQNTENGLLKRPAGRRQLREYVEKYFNIQVPSQRLSSAGSCPLDYLWHSFSADTNKKLINTDCIVWANRGGGKTMLAAAATILDCVFKPGCQIRILAGSFDQANRMYEYLVNFARDVYPDMIEGKILKTGFALTNGSRVELLTQSNRSVRGHHVNKLRCDELEHFDPAVFRAAQFITHSNGQIKAGMEICSTMHRPYGLMQKEIEASHRSGRPIFKWSLWEVIERCRGRACESCPLEPDCRGIAKNANGYYKIDDAISQMQRSSRQAWESEMLCLRPRIDNIVFSSFDPDVHVQAVDFDASLPLYRTIDFGYVNPFVCLWIQAAQDGQIRVINEYSRRRETADVHAKRIIELTPARAAAAVTTYCDPAGAQHNDTSGTGPAGVLRSFGIKLQYRSSRILTGVELIRRHLKDASGKTRLVINPRCRLLIRSLETYHYQQDCPDEMPVKDGSSDHAIDALRYFFVNYNDTKNTHAAKKY